MKKYIVIFILIVNSLFINSQKIPQLTGRVVDNGNFFSNSEIIKLTEYLAKYEEQTKHQLVIVTINSLEGYTIEEYSIKLAEKWKIGRKDYDDGIIIVISRKERKIRIEVGYGLEEFLTDAQCSYIIRNIISPNFRNGEYFKALQQAIIKISELTGGKDIFKDIDSSINNYDFNKNYETKSKDLYKKNKKYFFIVIIFLIIGFILGKKFKRLIKNDNFDSNNSNIIKFLIMLGIAIIGNIIIFLLFDLLVTISIIILITGFIISLLFFSDYFSGDGYTLSSNYYDSSYTSSYDSGGGFSDFFGGGGDFGGGGASGDW